VDNIVLLAVAAAWAAVLIPPLLRSRMENRPNSSVTDFRRQLSTLQRSVPTRNMGSMRSIGRPLAPSGFGRPTSMGRPGQAQRSAAAPAERYDRAVMQGATLQRRDVRSVRHGRGLRVSERELTRRRRANVLFVLAATVVLTAFLAATTQARPMVYLFALAFVSLCGYCYKLVQLRQLELDRQAYADAASWFHVA
jgi:hypothetical protein